MPDSEPLRSIPAPASRRGTYTRSPIDWRSQVIYFLLPDRFSDDSLLTDENLLDRSAPQRQAPPDGPVKSWYWNHWAISGRNRFQGGTLNGIRKRLRYLKDLGVTTLWIGPVWKQHIAGVDVNDNHDGTDDPFLPPKAKDLQGRWVGTRPSAFRKVEVTRDDYHAYAIQNFLGIDPRFGDMNDLRNLVDEIHRMDMLVIVDIVINHATEGFTYGVPGTLSPLRPPYPPASIDGVRYPFGQWLDANNRPILGKPVDLDAGIWPQEFHNELWYSRQGSGDYGLGFLDDANAEFRRADYRNRDIQYPSRRSPSPALDAMVDLWSYWIAELDLDGFRVDTFKHVPKWVAADFTERIRAFAEKLSSTKNNFLVVGEVGGTDAQAATYLDIPGVHILELQQRRSDLRELAAGNPTVADRVLTPLRGTIGGDQVRSPDPSVNPDTAQDPALSAADARELALPAFAELITENIVTTIDDHDGLGLDLQTRIAARYGAYAVIPAAAALLFGPGVPCLYYGTEQALCGPTETNSMLNEFGWTAHTPTSTDLGVGWGTARQGGDRYLREAMFGPLHPRGAGRAGLPGGRAEVDATLPGFGPMGTAGFHVFDQTSPWYRAIAAMAHARNQHPVLGTGTIARLTVGQVDHGGFGTDLPAQLIVWIRRDRASGAAGLVVLDVAPPMYPEKRTIDLLLPRSWRGRRLTQVVAVSARTLADPDSTMRTDAERHIHELPQSRTPYLPLGDVTNGEVRVFVLEGE